MKFLPRLTIRSKLTLIVMTASCAALIIAAVALGIYDQYSYRADLLQEATTRAEIVANNSTAALAFGDAQPVEEVLAFLGADPHLVAAIVFDEKGREFARYQRPGFVGAQPRLDELGNTDFVGGFLQAVRPIHLNGRRVGTVFLRSDLEELAMRRSRTAAISGVVLIAAAGFAYLLAWLLQRLISRPIMDLSVASRAVASQRNYSIRVPTHGHDELGQLIHAFNDMLSQIHERDLALQHAQSQLERRVTDRTRELFESNSKLMKESVENLRAREESDALRRQLEAAFNHLQREVEERAEVQEALRRSEERFSKAFKASPVPLAVLSRRARAVVDVNDRFAELVGAAREAVIGCGFTDMPLWSVPETRAKLEHAFENGYGFRNWQCEIGGRTSQTRASLLSVEPLMLGSEPCLLLMVEDISERASLEAQLRQAQKMDAIGQLASGVAHDFNNLLTIIQGHTQLVLATQQCSDKAREALNKVANASQRAAQLTRQLLTFSRKQVVQLKTLDLNQVIGNVTVMLGPLLGESVRLTVKAAGQLPSVEADSGMLEQIIVNLAVNARDAMPRGGDLIVCTSAVDIDASYTKCQPQARPGRFVCLQVSDTGTGMDAQTLERIFEPFFTTKGVGKGTGLGLATVYGIVKQHQGWVEVGSQLGVGTTFRIFLPAIQAPAATHEAGPEPAQVAGGKETILVVEDEPLLRELVTQILRDIGYRVMEAPHGKEALKVWESAERKPDLLLTDMMMPEGMTGWELAEQLRGRVPDLKVIYTSGYSTELFGRNLDLGERANFLPKPYNPRTLAKVVRDCLDN